MEDRRACSASGAGSEGVMGPSYTGGGVLTGLRPAMGGEDAHACGAITPEAFSGCRRSFARRAAIQEAMVSVAAFTDWGAELRRLPKIS
jgi:hypothetical protein